MSSKYTFKIISLMAIIVIVVTMLQICSDNRAIVSRLTSVENEQKLTNLKFEGIEEFKRKLNEESSERRTLQPTKETQAGNNEPIFPTTLNTDASLLNSPYIGDNSSPLIVMAFLDYQCSPCKQFYRATFSRLKSEYIDLKKVKFIFRDFPLPSNTNSTQAARFARCAGEQGYYWEAFNVLFEQPERVDLGKFSEIAASIKNIQTKTLNTCFEDSYRYSSEIKKDSDDARQLGAKGAPAFFIGENITNSTEIPGVLIRGGQPFQVIKHQIENLLYNHRNQQR